METGKYWKRFIAPIAVLALLGASAAQATVVTHNYDQSFGAAPPQSGGPPYATAVFDDEGSTGTVTATLSVFGDGVADVTGWYFNVSDESLLTGDLTITQGSGEQNDGISIGPADAYKADGDGFYDILIVWDNNTFTNGETAVFNITGTGITAATFDVFGSPGGPGNPGPYLSVTRWQSTGGGDDSDWIGAVPIPAAAWLFGSALLGMVGIGVRRKTAT